MCIILLESFDGIYQKHVFYKACLYIEPFANDKLEDNLNPVGRLFYAGSTTICIPASLSQNGPALGAQVGELGISQVVKAGGFKHLKRATQTPFNIIYEAKP